MNGIPLSWRRAIVLAAVFAIGAVFGRLVIPLLFHDVNVMVINGEKDRGCEGFWALEMFRFGRYHGVVDGAYKIDCGQWSHPSATVALRCRCE